MRFFRYCLLLSVLLSLSQCKKNTIRPQEPELPAETQSGQQTLGFKANGTIYVAPSLIQVVGSWTGSNTADRFYFAGDARDRNYILGSIGVTLRGDLSDGQQFQLVNEGQIPAGQNYGLAAVNIDPSCVYAHSTDARLLSGQVTLTRFDGGARVAAGRFQMTFVKAGCDTLRITEGRFDVKF
ncbi:hypothetical protein SAMN02746009_00347 [Hymenobacter psychrotolerans DSM 18569]|uniref:Uncharacterized protein n=2 Tax=Hymenobacter psychrotolerans TaxID=344998 RepID=A0A1M6PUK3_9BACT|nr:hypothetical protein SAMN02746009_00347 [Hymenobacter psychrotolerans DSM 18569]